MWSDASTHLRIICVLHGGSFWNLGKSVGCTYHFGVVDEFTGEFLLNKSLSEVLRLRQSSRAYVLIAGAIWLCSANLSAIKPGFQGCQCGCCPSCPNHSALSCTSLSRLGR